MIRKRTTLTTTERKQRLFCLLFGSVLLGAALGIVMLRWQYDGVPTSWACFLGMFLEKRSSLAALWLGSIGNILPVGVFRGGTAFCMAAAADLRRLYGRCLANAVRLRKCAGAKCAPADLFCAGFGTAGGGIAGVPAVLWKIHRLWISGRTDRSDVPPAANVLCPFCRTAGAAGTAYAVI